MNFFKNFNRDKWLYNGLIGTFILLYAATAFVSFYHAITFFNIANAIWLSVLLSFVAEIGQASVLFSILLTKHGSKFLPWMIMFILTTLQVIGNVVSSFDWIVAHNDAGLDGFKRSILFFLQTEDAESFRIIVAWISGALLPVIALSMTALVAQNLNIRKEEKEKLEKTPEFSGSTQYDVKIENNQIVDAKDIISEVSKIRPTEEDLSILQNILARKTPIMEIPKEEESTVEKGAPFDEPVYNPDLSQPYDPMDEYNKEITTPPTASEPSIDIEPPEFYMSGEDVEESDEFDTPEEDEFDPEDIKTIQDIVKTPPTEVVITQNNGLVDIVPVEEKVEEPEKIPNETPPIIELEKKPDETPEIQKPVVPPPIPRNEHFTPDRLEKIRQIARDNLKKK